MNAVTEMWPRVRFPGVREAGTGPDVVCLHASASSSAQWRGLMERLAPRYHVVAVDALGVGTSPRRDPGRPLTLSDEAELIEPVLRGCRTPAVLVGHSYGGAVALVAALAMPSLVRALVLYEPTLFSLVDAHSPPPNDADGIRRTVRDAGLALDRGDRAEAARIFVDFWMGAGSWKAAPARRQQAFMEAITEVRDWGHALFGEPAPLAAFRAVTVPVLYMLGGRSPPDALAVARLLVPVLPGAEVAEFPELDHMGPLTDPERTGAAIETFLGKLA